MSYGDKVTRKEIGKQALKGIGQSVLFSIGGLAASAFALSAGGMGTFVGAVGAIVAFASAAYSVYEVSSEIKQYAKMVSKGQKYAMRY